MQDDNMNPAPATPADEPAAAPAAPTEGGDQAAMPAEGGDDAMPKPDDQAGM